MDESHLQPLDRVLESLVGMVRFLSCEPLLGPVDFKLWLPCSLCSGKVSAGWSHAGQVKPADGVWSVCPECKGYPFKSGTVDWVIVGGESGDDSRPIHPAWACSIRDQCQAAGVPFFFKQWGEFGPFGGIHNKKPQIVLTVDGHQSESHNRWGREDQPVTMTRIGKKAAGRLLDGQEWSQFPSPSLEERQ